jgi:rhodanese-related sulfurtransferase
MASKLRSLALALAMTLPSIAVSGPPPASTAASPDAAAALASIPTGVVDGPSARRLVAAGARLVDVRTQQEFDAGHLDGATLLPYDQIAARAAELGPKETPIVLYCRTGRRTAIAAKALAELGYARVWDLKGMSNW